MLLVAASGVTWLSLEGLSLLPTPLKVLISFWGDLGETLCCQRAPLSNAYLASEIHGLSLQARKGGTQMGQRLPVWVTLGTRETGTPAVCWGGESSSEALMQGLHNFLIEGWGTPGALIRPPSPQFGDQAAAEIWQIRTISQTPEWRELPV